MVDGCINKMGVFCGIVFISVVEWFNFEFGIFKFIDFEFVISLLGVVVFEDRGGEEVCVDG